MHQKRNLLIEQISWIRVIWIGCFWYQWLCRYFSKEYKYGCVCVRSSSEREREWLRNTEIPLALHSIALITQLIRIVWFHIKPYWQTDVLMSWWFCNIFHTMANALGWDMLQSNRNEYNVSDWSMCCVCIWWVGSYGRTLYRLAWHGIYRLTQTPARYKECSG